MSKEVNNVSDFLKSWNRGQEESDKVKIASDHEDSYFVRNVVDSGSPYLNYRINKSTGRGGFIRGSYNMIIGGEGSAKTSIALIAGANMQREEKKYFVYFDGEGSMNESYLDRFGVDRELLIYHKGRNLEDMLNMAEAFSKLDDVGMIVLDSIPIFVSTSVEEKSAEDHHMAVEARKFTTRMPIIEGNCSRRNICLLGLTFYTTDPGQQFGDNRVVKRVKWQMLMSNLTLDITKKALIFNEKKKPIGHIIDVRVKKSKLSAYDSKDAFQLNFYYDYGFNKYDEYFEIFKEEEIITGSGWYSFGDENGEEVKIQGKTQFVTYLKENEAHFKLLLSRLNIEESISTTNT